MEKDNLMVFRSASDSDNQTDYMITELLFATESTANLVNSLINLNDTCIRELNYVSTIYESSKMLLVFFSGHHSL